MSKGSARQKKKLTKRLALKMVQAIAPKEQQRVSKPKKLEIEPKIVPRVTIEETQPTKHKKSKQQPPRKIKKKKLNRKQRKRLKLQQRQLQKQHYRDKVQEQYYKEHEDREYTNEAYDMTDEYANAILNDLNTLADYSAKQMLIDIFYNHYNKDGSAYIQQLHDTGADVNIHDVVEVAVAQYKGYLPDKWYTQMAVWLNVGAPIESRNAGIDNDNDDISSEYYE